MAKHLCFFLLFLLPVLIFGCNSPNLKNVPALELAFADREWDGKTIPRGQQCRRFGGQHPGTPRLLVKKIPEGTAAIIMEYSDRSYPPMDRGGHGKIGYDINPGATAVTIPSVPGHSHDLPEKFFLVSEHKAPGWDQAGAYLPPCSGGGGNSYYVTVKAVKKDADNKNKYDLLGKGVLELGTY